MEAHNKFELISGLEKVIGNQDNECININQIKDKELGKEYDVYLLEVGARRYIVKGSSNSYEGDVYEKLLNKKGLCIPIYYGRFKCSKGKEYIVVEYVKGNVFTDEGIKSYVDLAKALAKLHKAFFEINFENTELVFLKESNDRFRMKLEQVEHNIGLSKYGLNLEVIYLLKKIIYRLKRRPQTLIQNDLLPINIIKGESNITIIDWELAGKGCYISDIGRLLSDFNNAEGEYWVNTSWEKTILESYYSEICMNNIYNISKEDFLLDYRCSRTINYAGIVIAHVINSWDISGWYELNLNAMYDEIDRINGGV